MNAGDITNQLDLFGAEEEAKPVKVTAKQTEEAFTEELFREAGFEIEEPEAETAEKEKEEEARDLELEAIEVQEPDPAWQGGEEPYTPKRNKQSEREELADEIKSGMAGMIGTETWHRHPLFRKFTYTDGVEYLAEKAGAYWLIDLILSYQCEKRISKFDFQVWRLKVSESKSGRRSAEATMHTDSDKPPRVKQHVDLTDFPLDEIELWLEDTVLLLPSEH